LTSRPTDRESREFRSACRFALNAPPSGLRRASRQAERRESTKHQEQLFTGEEQRRKREKATHRIHNLGLIVSHIFCWTPGVLMLLMPNRAPKGRTTSAQANGLGPRTPTHLAASPERAK
jgi:hypothetical protein